MIPLETYEDSIREIARRKLLGEVTGIEQIKYSGSSNKTFYVKTGTGEFVFRINDAKLLHIFLKEMWCMNLVKDHIQSAVKARAVGVYKDLSYIVITYLPGRLGSSIEKADTREKVWYLLGAQAKLIHQIGVKGFGGRMDSSNLGQFRDTWGRFLNQNISAINEHDPLLQYNILTKDELRDVKRLFESLTDVKFSFGLSHGDISLNNSIVRQNGESIPAQDDITLIDWGAAEANIVPHFDIMKMIRGKIYTGSPTTSEFEAFIKGYGMSAAQFGEIVTHVEALMLLRAVDRLRGALNSESENLESYVTRVHDAVRMVFKY